MRAAIDTNDGVVMLSGKVPSAEKKTLAEQKVRSLDGVRSVKNLLVIFGAQLRTQVFAHQA